MSLVPFDSLPADARLWCFGASRRLDAEKAERLGASMADFVEGWTAHRRDLRAGFLVLHGQFLLVAVNESAAGASGCSIDALMGRLRSLSSDLEVEFLDSMPVWYRDPSGEVRRVARSVFSEKAARGELSAETSVFDLTLTRLADYLDGGLEAPAGDTWHRGLLTPA